MIANCLRGSILKFTLIGLCLLLFSNSFDAFSCQVGGQFLTLAEDASHFHTTFKGRALQGKGFQRPFGERFIFVLNPLLTGWEIVVKEHGRDENLARLTPPFHFVPNPRFIEGWHLLENPTECKTREYLADVGPDNPREFIFSPEVGRGIDGPNASRSVEVQEVEKIRRFGRGLLTIERFKLQQGPEGCPVIEWMEFSVRLEVRY